jgi:hypothetical protein
VADDDADRPLLTEMAEKLRQARSTSFTDRPEPAPPEPAPRAAPQPRPGGRESAPGGEQLPAPTRIDSLERRLFELRTALEDAVGKLALPAAGTHAPSDSVAWIAFAAAAMSEYDDATAQAEAADQLLAEYRLRRADGGVLSGEG